MWAAVESVLASQLVLIRRRSRQRQIKCVISCNKQFGKKSRGPIIISSRIKGAFIPPSSFTSFCPCPQVRLIIIRTSSNQSNKFPGIVPSVWADTCV